MGLFDSLKSKKEPTFDPQKSVMTIVVASIMADGDASDEEIGRMRSMCARSPIFSKNTKDEDDTVIDFAINVVKQLGDDGIAKAANALKPELKETAFAFASEIDLPQFTVPIFMRVSCLVQGQSEGEGAHQPRSLPAGPPREPAAGIPDCYAA